MRYGPKTLTVSFGGKNLTHFGGVYLLHRFFKKIGLRAQLNQSVRFPQRNNRYTIAEEVLALIYPICLGLGRIETTHFLKHNGVFQYLTGLPTYPNPTTLRRFLLRWAPLALPKLRRLHSRMQATMIERPSAPTRIILDLDSTVLTLYGKQEKARRGYNPLKRNRVSYHPLICFEGLTKDFWDAELRSGEVHTASGTIPLLEQCFARALRLVKTVIVRGDKGFYDHKTVEYIESKGASYAIAARLSKPLKEKLTTFSYTAHRFGVQTAEFYYQPRNWKKPQRFVIIRRPIPEDPSEQLTLFSLGRYSYQAIVTDLKLSPLNVWKFYNGRAGIELVIKELKGNYPLAKIPTKHFAANEAYFHLLLLAYNLINWFKRICLPQDFQNATLATLRTQILLIPSELVISGNKPLLKLPTTFPHKEAFNHAIKKIDAFKF